MSCSACSARVEKAVNKLDGIDKASVNLLTNSMQASYDENVVSEQDIIQAVVDAGYGASPAESGSPQSAGAPQKSASDITKEEMKAMKHRLIGSILFLIPVMYIAMHHMFYEWFGIPVPEGFQYVFHGDENAITFAFTQFLLILPIMYLNRKYYVNGFRNLFQGAPNMDSLVGLGSMAAAVYGVFAIFRMSWGMGHGDWALVAQYSTNLYFESAGMIVTLIDIGKFLEARAKGKTSTAIEKLMDLAPKQATVLRNGVETVIPVEDLVVGDEIVIRPGESIPADGVISEGTTSVDEAAITGESIPVEKQVGDKVTSATINKTGFIHITARRVGADTTISQIIKLVTKPAPARRPSPRWPIPSLATSSRPSSLSPSLPASSGTSSWASMPNLPSRRPSPSWSSPARAPWAWLHRLLSWSVQAKGLKTASSSNLAKPWKRPMPSIRSSWTRPAPSPKAGRKLRTSFP